jgi:thiamine phosphate synthase YjbQ (UPF0047 family)
MPGTAVRSRIEIETRARTEVIDITDRVGRLVESRGDGLCYLFNKHTTSALMVSPPRWACRKTSWTSSRP